MKLLRPRDLTRLFEPWNPLRPTEHVSIQKPRAACVVWELGEQGPQPASVDLHR